MFNDTTTTRLTQGKIYFRCFSQWLTCGLFAWEGQRCWEITREKKKNRSVWLVIFLSLNVFYCLWSNEWNQHNSFQGDRKNGRKRAAPFKFIFFGLPCILYKHLHPLPTSTPLNLTILSHFYLDLYPHLWLFSPPVLAPHSLFLIPIVLFPLLYLNTLLPASPYSASHLDYRHSHQSWFCFMAERSGLPFWLHINCKVRTQMRIVKQFLQLLYNAVKDIWHLPGFFCSWIFGSPTCFK